MVRDRLDLTSREKQVVAVVSSEKRKQKTSEEAKDLAEKFSGCNQSRRHLDWNVTFNIRVETVTLKPYLLIL